MVIIWQMNFQPTQTSDRATMVFVSSAVLGAATGTGLALLIACSIVIYRYYVVRRKIREWDELDRWEETKLARKIKMMVSCEFTKKKKLRILVYLVEIVQMFSTNQMSVVQVSGLCFG